MASDRAALTFDDHLRRLRIEGERLADVAATTPLHTAVPGCPGWDVEALVRHIGDVHRWAGTVVSEGLQERLRRDFVGPAGHRALLAWYREGHAWLVDVLAATPPDAQLWSWAETAPTAREFWARRQAHETAIHRLDAEQAAGTATPFPPDVGADGVDEWLIVLSTVLDLPSGAGRRLHLAATDVDAQWVAALGPGRLSVYAGATEGDCSVRAPAGDLFALVTNRRDATGLDVEGDADVLREWRESARF